MIVAFFFTPAGDARGGTPAHQEAERPSAERTEYADVDFLLGLIEPKPCFSLLSWVRGLGW